MSEVLRTYPSHVIDWPTLDVRRRFFLIPFQTVRDFEPDILLKKSFEMIPLYDTYYM